MTNKKQVALIFLHFIVVKVRLTSGIWSEKTPLAYDNIIVQTYKQVGLVTLNRPEARNALNQALMGELSDAIDVFDGDGKIGAIVITGNEKAFAAGVDIKEMQSKTYIESYRNDFLAPLDRVGRSVKPIIAAVAGYALGGGCELAMICDMIFAATNAKFGLPELSVGVIPGAGGTQRLARSVGKAKAMDLVLTGRVMDADEAERSGLVARIVAPEALIDTALQAAEKIAEFSIPAVMMARESLNRSYETSLSEGLRFERRVFQSMFATADQKEGMQAFIEKRSPNFKDK